jgi:hypothetical protein
MESTLVLKYGHFDLALNTASAIGASYVVPAPIQPSQFVFLMYHLVASFLGYFFHASIEGQLSCFFLISFAQAYRPHIFISCGFKDLQ